MVLQVLANSRQFDLYRNTSAVENVLGSNSTDEEHVRTTRSAARQNDLFICRYSLDGIRSTASKFDARSDFVPVLNIVSESDLCDCRVGENVKVVTRRERVDVCGPGVRASPVGGVDGGSRDEGAVGLATIRARVVWDTEALKSGLIL